MENKSSRIKMFFENLQKRKLLYIIDENSNSEDSEEQYDENITYEDLLSFTGKPAKVKAKFTGTILNIEFSGIAFGKITVALEGDFKRIVILTYLDSNMDKEFAVGNIIKFFSWTTEVTDYKSDLGEVIKVPLIDTVYIENL